MSCRQLPQNVVGLGREHQQDPTPVHRVGDSEQEPSPHQPVHQSDGGMRLQKKVAREIPNRDPTLHPNATHRQKGLMLLGH